MRILIVPVVGLAIALGCGAAEPPIQGKKRGELCDEVSAPPAFVCPNGTIRRGGPPPGASEMWCERKGGVRHGPYRRFPPNAQGAGEPAFIGDGVVIGAYDEDRQDGAWWTRRQGSPTVNVAYYERGEVVQRISCQQ